MQYSGKCIREVINYNYGNSEKNTLRLIRASVALILITALSKLVEQQNIKTTYK